MFSSSLIDLFLYKTVYDFLTGPTGVIAILSVVGLLLWLAGIFVTFRNGVLSYVLYLLLLFGFGLLLFQGVRSWEEDLQLTKDTWVTVQAITSDGLVAETTRFGRSRVYPLLGVTPSIKPTEEAAVAAIATGRVRIQHSAKYAGVVAYTEHNLNINQHLLQNGWGVTTEVAPREYYLLEQTAKRNRVGVWQQVSCSRKPFSWWSVLTFLFEVGWYLWLRRQKI